MVLSWRPKWTRVFDGDSDGRSFFFYNEKAILRGKTDEKKAFELVVYTDGPPLDVLYETFEADRETKPGSSEFPRFKVALIDHFGYREDQKTLIRMKLPQTLASIISSYR